MKNESISIIGAGFAGLSAGIYAQINGYKTRILEAHTLPGGLCTAWKRGDFVIDGCVHWLVGSSPKSGMYKLWEEVGIVPGRDFFYAEEYMRYESKDGRTVIFYSDVDKFEKHLLEFSPGDEKPIKEFTEGIRMCLGFDRPSDTAHFIVKIFQKIRMGLFFIANGRKLKNWMNITTDEFVQRFKDPVLREAFLQIWITDFSMFFMLFTFAFLHNKNAGYPIGGSMPLSKALEKKYRELGGEILYGKKVEKILTVKDRATGVKLADGTEYCSDIVVSAADGYSTIFKMLEGKYADEKTRTPYEKWKIFPSLVYVAVGVNMTFEKEPKTVSGICFELEEPVEIADWKTKNLTVHIFNQDSSLAPQGKTVLTVMIPSGYDYWVDISKDQEKYRHQKEKINNNILEILEKRFPGLKEKVEMTDVSTPLTFERYTGNWKGSFEGWLITPENSNVIMKPMNQTLPSLENFYMCGQWVEPGGGLPTGVMSARRLLKKICKKSGKKFTAFVR
ncbi:NAD(P)/FAD-dependent oxidoreductase [candidate division WOR-3 bacterium]|nr:NAD(P)/FAD-dependent oxidoreductase [candidate division WOR-3 bacterium]